MRSSSESPRTRTIAVALLGLAMCVSAAWLMLSARHTTFSGDDVYYYARYIAHGFATEPGNGVEYFLAPHNGHLQLGGKLIYRLLFELVGTDYNVFRAVDVAALLVSVGLFFVLARRRVGSLLALAPSILLLFLGYAYEPLIWAFDLHTVVALALGLGAILAIERGDRRGDVLACVLLVLSVSMIELGLAFVVGIAVSVLLRSDRWRRSWIFLVPIALYAIWWIWARQFHQSSITLLNVHLIPIDEVNALAAVAGSITGLNPTGVGVPPQLTTVTAAGTVVAALIVIAVAARAARGRVPDSLWVFAAVVVAYWITIALGGRAPDSSRYILAGSFLVFLVLADAAAALRVPPLAVAAAFALVALALPANLAKYYDGRRLQLNDAAATLTENGMLELARREVEPGYTAGSDPAVVERGGGVNAPLPAGEYFRAAGEFGRLSYSPSEVAAQPLLFREVADATLVHAKGLALESSGPPASHRGCFQVTSATNQNLAYFELEGEGVLLGEAKSPADVRLSRFAKEGPGFEIGQVQPGTWARLRVTPDSAPERWRVLVGAPLAVCPLGG